MSDTAEALNRIAEILAEESFLQTTAGQFVILVAGALVGGYMTYRFGKKHQQEMDAIRKAEELRKTTGDRHLLTVLLGDEIVLRWKDQIGGDLKKHLSEFSLDNVSEIYDITFLPHDLYMFQQCAQDVFKTNLFEDGPMVSNVVYVHTLSKDLADGLKAIKTLCDEYRRTDDQLTAMGEKEDASRGALEKERGTHVERLHLAWKSLQKIYLILDAQMTKIYTHIENDYRSCIASSKFVPNITGAGSKY